MKRVAILIAAGMVAGCASENDVFEVKNFDNWAQAPNNEVDILWVVDDSCSMEEEQDTLASGFSTFVGQMEESGTEFHIGVISTSFDYSDAERGRLIGEPSYLTKDDDYEALFQARATVGVLGSDKEKGLEAMSYSLSPTMTTGPNAGFLRADAQLLVVVVSDEEDCSDEGALEGEPAAACYTDQDRLVPVSEYVSDLRSLKASNDMIQLGAIVGSQQAACQDVYPGERYMQAAALTGGLIGDICRSDWSQMLTELGLNASGIRVSFQLSMAAQPESIVVWVDDVEVPQSEQNGWTYDQNTWFLTFHNTAIPVRGAQISAEYTVQSGVAEPPGAAEPGTAPE